MNCATSCEYLLIIDFDIDRAVLGLCQKINSFKMKHIFQNLEKNTFHSDLLSNK
ncbi:hypothetical protein FHS70_005223 [Flammeovirga yaeyamensis]|nr:hypothetical protein [Flammeovirga yaeyamensis]